MLRANRTKSDAAFVTFMTTAQPSLLRTAFFLTGSDDLARELTQDALVRAYLAWPRIRDEDALAYTRRILVNRRVDHIRHASRQISTDVLPEIITAADSSREDRETVAQLLATLPQQQRTVVVLRYYTDLSERDVADLLSISIGTVKSAASRGLAALRTVALTEGSPP